MKSQRLSGPFTVLLFLFGLMLLIAPQATQAQAPKSPKLDTVLLRLNGAARVSATAVNNLAESQGLRLSGNRVQVQVLIAAAQTTAAREAIIAAGGEVTGSGFGQTVLQAWLPITALTQVAAAPAVHFIRRPIQAYPLENLAVGQSTTEALSAINASAWHNAGYQGAGVKIAIIDAGFLGYGSLLGSDLPPNVTVKNFVDGETDTQADGTTEHGTACAEIIHDLAPQAEIYLVKIATDVDLAEAVTWLISEEVDIISSSFGFYNAAPGDGSGPIAELVSQAQAAGILWITAAGNDREAHWGGLFSDADGDGRHEFTPGQEVNCFVTPAFSGLDCSEYGFILVGLVGQLNIFVRWSDWEAVDQDYDLHLMRLNEETWEIVPDASSANPQDGGAGQTPTEWISYTPAADGDFDNLLKPHGILIERVRGNRPVNFELFVPQFGGLLRPQTILTARSLANLADSPAAITVAALDVNAPYPQEAYSSEGPTNGPGGVADGGLVKPNLAGFANVSTQSYGANAFNGTSSATPHVAGTAAVALSAFPTYSPTQLRALLEGRAVDMGDPGLDTQFGHGRVHLGNPPTDGINNPPLLTTLPDQTLEPDSDKDNALDLWAYASDVEDSVAALSFTISNTPVVSAGVLLDSNRYVDIQPTLGWSGTTPVEIQVQDTGGLTMTSRFAVQVVATGEGENDGTYQVYLPAILKR